jgi:spore maturation protein SpmB
MDQSLVIRRVASAARSSIGPSLRTTRFLVAVMVPVSLAVTLMDRSGVLRLISGYIDPVMGFLGLPGESSLVFISAVLLNNYSAIAVIGTLQLSARELAILAVMCLIAHNLIVECAVMKRTGSSVTKMAFLRISMALAAAFLLNHILPLNFLAGKGFSFGGLALNYTAPAAHGGMLRGVGLDLGELPSLLAAWGIASGMLVLKMAILISLLMLAQKLMEEFGLIELLSSIMKPFMRLLGLPPTTSFLWIVANVLGLAYGSAIMIERSESGKLSLSDGDLFNHHVAMSHSLLEDTLLFFALGVPLFWLMIPRIVLAVVVVWSERIRRVLFRRSFQVGTIK